MAKSKLMIVRTDQGDYKWRLVDAGGATVQIESGSVPGLRRMPGRAAVRDAVQAGLKALYERQQAATR